MNNENTNNVNMHVALNKVVELLRMHLIYETIEIYGVVGRKYVKITFPNCAFIHTCDQHDGTIITTHIVLNDMLKNELQTEINNYSYPSITVDKPNIYSMFYHTIAAYHKQVEEEINLVLDPLNHAGVAPKISIDGIYNLPQHFLFALEHQQFLPVIKQTNLHYHIFADRHIEKC
jgi:hypothetical protein